MNELLINLIPSLFISIITAYITVKLSVKQFYSQRWWEKKRDTYSLIIDNLSDLKYCFGEWLDDAACDMGRKLNEEEERKLARNYNKIKEYLIKTVAIGEYVISAKIVNELRKLLKKLENDGFDPGMEDLFKYHDECYTLIEDSISKIREYAKKDLKIKKNI